MRRERRGIREEQIVGEGSANLEEGTFLNLVIGSTVDCLNDIAENLKELSFLRCASLAFSIPLLRESSFISLIFLVQWKIGIAKINGKVSFAETLENPERRFTLYRL